MPHYTCIGLPLPNEGEGYTGKCATRSLTAATPHEAAEDYFSRGFLARERTVLVSDGNYTHAFRYGRPVPTPRRVVAA